MPAAQQGKCWFALCFDSCSSVQPPPHQVEQLSCLGAGTGDNLSSTVWAELPMSASYVMILGVLLWRTAGDAARGELVLHNKYYQRIPLLCSHLAWSVRTSLSWGTRSRCILQPSELRSHASKTVKKSIQRRLLGLGRCVAIVFRNLVKESAFRLTVCQPFTTVLAGIPIGSIQQ